MIPLRHKYTYHLTLSYRVLHSETELSVRRSDRGGVEMLHNPLSPQYRPTRGLLLLPLSFCLSTIKNAPKTILRTTNRTNKQNCCCTAVCNNQWMLAAPPAGIPTNSRAPTTICTAHCATKLDPKACGLHAICICWKTDIVGVAMTKS